jgi:hypothetical protein
VPVVFSDLVGDRPAIGHRLTVIGVKRPMVIAIDPAGQVNMKEVSGHVATRARITFLLLSSFVDLLRVTVA